MYNEKENVSKNPSTRHVSGESEGFDSWVFADWLLIYVWMDFGLISKS